MRWPAKPARASRVNAARHDAPVVDRRLALPAVMSALMVAARGAVSAGRPSSLPTANGARVTGALRHRPTLRRLVAVMCERLPPCARACATFSPRYACIARMNADAQRFRSCSSTRSSCLTVAEVPREFTRQTPPVMRAIVSNT